MPHDQDRARLPITSSTFAVHCKQCRHRWKAFLPLPMPMHRAAKVMRGIVQAGCPACGAYGLNVLCGNGSARKREPE